MILDRILSVIKNTNNILDVFDSIQEGSIIFHSGNDVVEVKTRKPPTELLISIDSDGMQVCNGDLDTVSYSLTADGFVLYANVTSNRLVINWYALFEIQEKD